MSITFVHKSFKKLTIGVNIEFRKFPFFLSNTIFYVFQNQLFLYQIWTLNVYKKTIVWLNISENLEYK